MAKSIFQDMGGTYHEENGYLIHDLTLPTEEEKPLGYGDSGTRGISRSISAIHHVQESSAPAEDLPGYILYQRISLASKCSGKLALSV